jgi:signal transduction histidine kinase
MGAPRDRQVSPPARKRARSLTIDSASEVTVTSLELENERLRTELRVRLEELRRSKARIVEARGTERRRLERDLHDGAQQRLVSLGLRLRLARGQITADPRRAEQNLSRASDELDLAVAELQELARGLHPPVLEHGLGAALKALAARAPLPVQITANLRQRVPGSVEVAAYYLVSEALTNIAKHANASAASVHLSLARGRVLIEVADDGIGGADPKNGSGLRGLVDRTQTLGGKLTISSPRSGGTRIRAEIPFEHEQ